MNKTEHNQTAEESLCPVQINHYRRPKQKRQKLHASTVLWRQSPTSLTRDRAPAHRIPKAERFCSTNLDLLKFQQLETLQSERQQQKGIAVSFPRSNRPEHFAKMTGTPSPASYLHNIMERSIGKAKTERSLSSTHPDIRSATINQFFNHHKLYLPQSKHRPYQPECTQDNPSPANYTPNATLEGKDIKYSFKNPLKRFRQPQNQSPGPAAYRPKPEQRSNSFNAKGTFPKSRRTYLSKYQPQRSSHSFSK